MFTQLAGLLKDCSSVNLILAMNKDRTLSVTVLPKPKATGEDAAALSTPLSLTATAEELDQGFVQILNEYVGAHQSLSEQAENTKAILEAAKAESQKKATTAISKSTKTTTTKPSESKDKEGDVDEDDENSGNDEGTDASTDQGTQSTNTEASAPADSLWE